MDCTSAFRQWWDDLTREGDPKPIPNPCAKGFTAGWYACEREHERQSDGGCVMGAHETAVHQLGLASETIAELKRQLAATQESYERVSELSVNLTATLRSIRDANYREWDKGLDPWNTTTLATPAEFVKWAQNIARNAIDPSFTLPLPLNDNERGTQNETVSRFNGDGR